MKPDFEFVDGIALSNTMMRLMRNAMVILMVVVQFTMLLMMAMMTSTGCSMWIAKAYCREKGTA